MKVYQLIKILIVIIRLVEIYDKQIYKLTNNILRPGRPIKRVILAGISIYLIADLLNKSKLSFKCSKKIYNLRPLLMYLFIFF